MIVTAYASCGRRLVGPTADITPTAARTMAATIRRHLRDCRCTVRVTVMHHGRLLNEATLTPHWLEHDDGSPV